MFNSKTSPCCFFKKKVNRSVFVLLFLSISVNVWSQLGSTIYVSGKHILGPCGDTLILRGVNYAAYNWGWSPTQLRINEIALSGANCVRIVWYKTPATGTPTSTYTNLTNLDSVLSKCIQHKLIPILDLHDLTCVNNPTALITLCNWYTQSNVKALINKYKHSLILNLANEALYVQWTGNPASSLTTFVNTYTTIVNTLRSNNITVPLMIDAPDCGQHLDAFTAVGNMLQNNDPLQRLIFSAHAYWYLYAGNDSLTMLNKLNNALLQNIPLVLGEIANTQDDATMCQYQLNYKPLLNICKNKKIGWMAWSWDNDGCPSRQISTNGLVSTLTAYGNEILNNNGFGLLTNPVTKSMYLVNNACLFQCKAYHSGYYDSVSNTMRPVLQLQGLNTPSGMTDSVQLEFHSGIAPYALQYSGLAAWFTNGIIEKWIPLNELGSTVLLSLKHRNTLETWSSNTTLISSGNTYNFSNEVSKAMGNNMVPLEQNVYGFYSGDINQDGAIDAIDYVLFDPLLITGASGYQASDLNGDGTVDALDYIILDEFIIQGAGKIVP